MEQEDKNLHAQQPDEAQTPAKQPEPKGYEAYLSLFDLVRMLAVITLMFVFFFRVNGVSGSSMYPTLVDKDYLVLESNFLYRNARQGDIVVLYTPPFSDNDELLVKRVIAVGGQTVDIDFNAGVVYVDGLRIGDTDPIVLRDRQKLANDGMVTAVAIVSLKHKKIEAIEFSGRGVSFAIDDQFSEDASASIMKTIEKGKFSFTSSGSDAIRKAVRDSLSNFIWSRTRTRPMIIPVVMEV